jgi:RecB family exonuclease
MPSLEDALKQIASRRRADPLAPVTVIAPSHVSALHLRRRLAETAGSFAGVRFETLPRIAELLGAATLARQGRRPLARPIGDYVAGVVARESGGALAGVSELPGYGRVLRQTFRRLRKGGFASAMDVPLEIDSGHLGEVRQLYGRFREATSQFYDEDDLLDAAADAIAAGNAGFAAELGDVWLVPPGAMSAAAERLLRALRPHRIDEPSAAATETPRFVLAPDPASEAREAAREVIAALDDGRALHEVAVFHGADRSYRLLLQQAFEAAGVPAVVLPGRPLIETPAGRGVLALAELPLTDFSRAETLDFLNLTPLRGRLPAGDGAVTALASAWQRLAREAGVTHGSERWQDGLDALIGEREEALGGPEELSERRRLRFVSDRDQASDLRAFIASLIDRLEPLRQEQPAQPFVAAFKAIVRDYLRPDAEALNEVEAEIDQLGTIDAVGGRFTLASFGEALRANLTAATKRERSLGDGVLVADYRGAAGLSYRHVVLCGAYEGVFPSVAVAESLVPDAVWARLRQRHPQVEDARLRQQRAQEAAQRAVATATGRLVWTSPLRDATGAGDRYPAPLMLAAAQALDARIETASALRTAAGHDWLWRPASPLAARLRGEVVLDAPELELRRTVQARQDGIELGPGHALRPSITLLRSRRGRRFSEFDGNLVTFEDREAFAPRATLSPTSLENYATCGFRYFLGSVLWLRPVQEPEERDTIDPAERGSLVHDALDAFFKEQQARGRPQPGEPWGDADLAHLLSLVDGRLEAARRRGLTGLDLYAGFDRRTIRADLAAFLEQDSEFRRETGAVPFAFELRIPQTQVGALQLTGFVDRLDKTPDGTQAWVIDYKTGSSYEYDKLSPATDPFGSGTKLQLPVYIHAAGDADKVTALYWFITRRAEFKKVEFTPTPQSQARFEATLASISDGLLAGAFPAIPGDDDEFRGGFANCRYCDFDRICSLRRNYELLDKQDDPQIAAWLRVGRIARGEELP